ncbi:hypothetical protein [Psychrobacter halodurans]|uniref:Repeat protein (TIGR01451 family) n=1 Tax=Psychrobacter halodurans TaxID=2818439 RepID=A0AAW4ISH5_9GAMM|nr:hypothetical protein [Psychrobacter halodurans]MBO1515757.1 hypothetical protein [Psychrobacter halodurans]
MYMAKHYTESQHVDSYQRYKLLFLAFVGAIGLLSINHSSYAIVPNPGANCQGVTGASQSSLTNADYTNLVSAVNTDNYVNIAGNASGSIPLQIKMNTTESSSNTILGNFGVIEAQGVRAINVRRTFPNTTAFTDIRLDFRNSITMQPIYLTNVALSAFDIDYANSSGNSFDDFIQITGVNEAGATITGTFQPITNSNIIFSQNLQGLLTRTTNDPNCPAKNLGTQCQGSVQFSEPVKSVNVRYSNTGYLATATNQEIDFRVDNYCYVPQYIFSGTVFDDNGGIPENKADKDNADITSASSVYANRPNYFNGRYDPNASETGIAGSTVQLVNCSNTDAIYPTQSVIRNNAPLGEYQISIPKTTLANNPNLCLLEKRTGTSYPIRTTSSIKTINVAANTYHYPNNDFGRVIAENAALVLRKSQYVNNCPATLNYTNINDSTSPKTGFSTNLIAGIAPGRCIAYKITATNRANVNIDNFVMQDELQKKGVANATVTSTLANPALTSADYDSSSPAVGQNGTVKTKPFVLPPRSKRDFYFNTRYGTTQ